MLQTGVLLQYKPTPLHTRKCASHTGIVRATVVFAPARARGQVAAQAGHVLRFKYYTIKCQHIPALIVLLAAGLV